MRRQIKICINTFKTNLISISNMSIFMTWSTFNLNFPNCSLIIAWYELKIVLVKKSKIRLIEIRIQKRLFCLDSKFLFFITNKNFNIRCFCQYWIAPRSFININVEKSKVLAKRDSVIYNIMWMKYIKKFVLENRRTNFNIFIL